MNAPTPVRCPSQSDRPSYGPWSLWDMLKLNAQDFYSASSFLGEIHAKFERREDDLDAPVDESSRKILGDILEQLGDTLVTLEAQITWLAVRRLQRELKDSTTTWRLAMSRIPDITSRLRDELSVISVFVLEKENNKYFDPKEPLFGAQIVSGFTTALYEIDEAAKCYALDRSTACVFHLMRTMEIGIAAVARCLGIPDPVKPAERNWGKILERIWAGIEQKWPTTAARQAGDGALFEALYASLDAVKNPWRNATMHVENKYTDEEAEHIFVAVRGFMKKLASRCDEHGEPKA